MLKEIVCTSGEFGESFREARKRAGLSIDALSKRLNDNGIKSDGGSMSRLERDMQEPGVIWAANAALELNTTLDGLVYRRKPDLPPTSRELKEREQKALGEIIETLTALNDAYPNIEWFEIAAASARGTRESVAEQYNLPAGHTVKKEGEITEYNAPQEKPRESKRMVNKHSGVDVLAGEDPADYAAEQKPAEETK